MTSAAAMERLYELLADRALVGLGPNEASELDALLRQNPGISGQEEALERAAAAVAIASLSGALDPLPARLGARLEAEGMETVRTAFHQRPLHAPHLAKTFPMPDAPPTPLSAPPPVQHAPISVQSAPIQSLPPSNIVPFARPAQEAGQASPPRPSRALMIAGWIAAAACLLLAIGSFFLRKPTIVTITPPPIPASTPTPAPVDSSPPPASVLREQLLAKAGTTKLDWAGTKDPAGKGASGDVVWSAVEQRGFMRFRGLAKNDPRSWQYQLWIFDKSREDKYPVDGGVFDVDAATGDVIVPIKARLNVADATLFAVTIEKPGGVVVSKRERIVVTAKPAG